MTRPDPDFFVAVDVAEGAELSDRLRGALQELAEALADESLPGPSTGDEAGESVRLGDHRRLDPMRFQVCIGYADDEAS